MKSTINLLVVDDNPADYNLIRRKVLAALSSRYEVVFDHAEDFQSSLKALEVKKYNCIILDYLLGAENGLDLMMQISALPHKTPVIFMTGQGDESIAVLAMKNGASDYLVKDDTTPDSLGKAVLNAIKKADLQRKLDDKQRELEDFAYTAAHDIKSPLATINQVSQLLQLKAQDLNDPDIIHYSQSLMEVSKNIIQFVNELLNYAKTGREDREFANVDLGALLKKVLHNLSTLIDNEGATLTLPDSLPVIQADEVGLMQLFQNIIQNSIKYRHPDRPPRISLSCNSDDKSLKLLFTDNGIGVPQKDHLRIFTPLVRIKSGAKTEGCGLGLAIARKIVDQHQGDIYIQSSSDQGTTIAVVLSNDSRS